MGCNHQLDEFGSNVQVIHEERLYYSEMFRPLQRDQGPSLFCLCSERKCLSFMIYIYIYQRPPPRPTNLIMYIYILMISFFFIKWFLLHPPSSWLFKLMMLCITDKWFTFPKYVTWKQFLRFNTMDGQIWCLNCTDNRLDGCSGEGLVFPVTYVSMWSLKQKHQQQWDKLNSKSVWSLPISI